MRHPLLIEGRPNCAQQSLASMLSAPRVAATSCCDPGRHANVVTPCLLTLFNMPKPNRIEKQLAREMYMHEIGAICPSGLGFSPMLFYIFLFCLFSCSSFQPSLLAHWEVVLVLLGLFCCFIVSLLCCKCCYFLHFVVVIFVASCFAFCSSCYC